jgi:hypothetical protein
MFRFDLLLGDEFADTLQLSDMLHRIELLDVFRFDIFETERL